MGLEIPGLDLPNFCPGLTTPFCSCNWYWRLSINLDYLILTYRDSSVVFFFLSDFAESTHCFPDSWSKAVSNIDLNSSRYSIFEVLLRHGPLRQIWLCANGTGHCGKFSYVLWAIAANLGIRYGLLRGMKQYSKNLYLFLRCGWSRRICLCAMGHNAVFGFMLPAVALNQIPEHRSTQQFSKACHILKRDCDAKKCIYINSNNQGLYHPSFKSLECTIKNLVPRNGPQRRMNFAFK